jgi:UDP-N-acetylglucosamine diphosphorylase / glucose-1-phosphate thymidylyltransferase / UDP-N-acetylgalactosamine diphosphorylase / glucosamine-1-phosphate N-acetyltransferase / galactosamine-1-phosphate N-acetyltransferase
MRLCIFEDDTYSNFYPLTYLRPTFQLRCGIFTLYERIVKAFNPDDITLICRKNLNPTLRESGYNPLTSAFDMDGRMLFINGTVIDAFELSRSITLLPDENTLYMADGRLVAAYLDTLHARQLSYYLLEQDVSTALNSFDDGVKRVTIDVRCAEFTWDFIEVNPRMIEIDIQTCIQAGIHGDVHEQAVLYNPSQIYIGEDAQIDAMVVIDARGGPIYIGNGVEIEPFSLIQGPTFIGDETRIVGGQIREGTSIGPVCRIGGEIEECIIQGYSNKYHKGFLGHAYLGEWVNIGAIATNSDLKNTYSNIRMEVNNSMVDTGLMKMGVVLGDHVKLGIGVMLVGGATVGVASNIMNGLAPKIIPPFVWSDGSNVSEYTLEKFIAVAHKAMERRKIELSSAQANLIRHVFYQTRQQRQPLYSSRVL